VPQLSGVDALFPGAPAVALPVRIENPNPVPILVTGLRVAATADPPECTRAENLSLAPASLSSAAPLRVPADGSASLPAPGLSPPTIQLRDLPVNQDACKNARFPARLYRGGARMRWLLPSGLTGVALAVALVMAIASGTAPPRRDGQHLGGHLETEPPDDLSGDAGYRWHGRADLVRRDPSGDRGGHLLRHARRRSAGRNCPSSASPVVVTTCTDSGVEIGTHSYVVTAKWRSWSAAGSAAAAKSRSDRSPTWTSKRYRPPPSPELRTT
jgi:hypothetical protein